MSLFAQAVASLQKVVEYGDFSLVDKQYVDEAIVRLRDIEDRYIQAAELNNYYLESDKRVLEMREHFNEESIFKMLNDNSEKDPKLKDWLRGKSSIKVDSKTEIRTFNLTENDDEKVATLHTATENIYNDLWSIKERLNSVSKYRNFNPSGVRDVRNHLIVHVEKYGATLYSFGIQTNGPVLRPVKPTNSKANHDKGLVSNVEEFLNEIIQVSDYT
jgi:hypothetical protein